MSMASGALAAEWLAAKTVAQLFHHLDGRDYAAAASLFAPDGYWLRLGDRLTGPAAVESALLARPAGLATRHLVTNIVAAADAEGVDARYYVTVFEDEPQGAGPARLGVPGAIFLTQDRLVPTDAGFRFAARAPKLVFKKA